MTAETILVTGAAGFVGRHLCAQLIERGYSVKGLVRRANPQLERLGVVCVEGDALCPSEFAPEISDVHAIVHCAGAAAFGNGREYELQNVQATKELLNVSSNIKGFKRFVYVSSIGAVDRGSADPCTAPLDASSPALPKSDYGKSKLAAEQAVASSGLQYSIVRPAMVIGGDMRYQSHFSVFIRWALEGRSFARLAWPGEFSFVHVEDLASALAICLSHPRASSNCYFCSSGSVRLSEVFRMARPRIKLPLPRWLFQPFAPLLPFRVKCLFFPALVANSDSLRELGWVAKRTSGRSFSELIARERCRVDWRDAVPGRTVITGACSGLGKAVFEKLVAHRHNVLLIDKNEEVLNQLQAEYSNVDTLVADLSDLQVVGQLLESTQWNQIPISELYLIAGMGRRGTFHALSLSAQQAIIDLNLSARLALGRSAAAMMSRAGFGRLVLIGSSSAFQPMPFMGTYAASNAALLSLGLAWGEELQDSGVDVLTVCPGGMATNFQKASGVKELAGEKLMPPDYVATRILRAVERRERLLIMPLRSWAMFLAGRVLPPKFAASMWAKLMRRWR